MLLLLIDGIKHKGLARVLVGKKFEAEVFDGLAPEKQNIVLDGFNRKLIPKAINSSASLSAVNSKETCIELDVYIDTVKKDFGLYHHVEMNKGFLLSQFFAQYKRENRQHALWLDVKNLDSSNVNFAIAFLTFWRDSLGMQNKLIVESSYPALLQQFTASHFFTCFYTPYFNPFLEGELATQAYVRSIAVEIRKYKVCALSGYYFQTPLLQHSFPNYPLLQWQPNSSFSLVNYLYNTRVANNSHILVSCLP